MSIDNKKRKKTSKKKFWGSGDLNIDKILLNARCVLIYGEIDTKTSKDITKQLLALGVVSKDPIYVRINSRGGSVTEGFSIIDTMRIVPCPIVTLICGEASSMGGLISVVGDKRLMTENSIWMGHPISVNGGYDYLNYKRDRFKFWDMLEKTVEEILKKHTGLSTKELVKMKNGELWLTAEACLEKGVIDNMV